MLSALHHVSPPQVSLIKQCVTAPSMPASVEEGRGGGVTYGRVHLVLVPWSYVLPPSPTHRGPKPDATLVRQPPFELSCSLAARSLALSHSGPRRSSSVAAAAAAAAAH